MKRFGLAVKSHLFVAVVLTLGGCSANRTVDLFSAGGEVWPKAPDRARVMYAGEFSKAQDLGIGQGGWSRVLKFAAGSGDDRMVRPMDVAVSNGGDVIFVADPDANCVHRYDIRRSRYRCMRLGNSIVSPVALAITADDTVYASDSEAGQLYRVKSGDKNLEIFATSVPLEQPTGIVWDPESDLLFVTDTAAHAVKVFDRAGNLRYAFGSRGNAPGFVNYPTYLWIGADGELLLTDSLNFRSQRFTKEGRFISSFGENGDRPGDFSRPKGVASDSHRHVYVVDALMHALQIFSREGELLLSIGRQGQAAGEFWLPNGIFITHDDRIFVADSYNKRIQVFRYIGGET